MPTDPNSVVPITALGGPVSAQVEDGWGHAIALQNTGIMMIYLVAIPNQGAPKWYAENEIQSMYVNVPS